MTSSEEKVYDDIKECGHHVMGVLEEKDSPRFSYSIGIEETLAKPELIIVGLKHSLALSLINDYYNRSKKGEEFVIGKPYSGFLDDFDVCFGQVSEKNRKGHLCWADWYYERKPFKALQLIYPSTSGVWPWEKAATEDFLWWQRALNETGAFRKEF